MIARFPIAALLLVLAIACGGGGGGDAGRSDAADAVDVDAPTDTPDGSDAADAADLAADAAGDDAPFLDSLPDVPPDAASDALPDADVPGPRFRSIDLSAVGDVLGMWSAPDGTAWAVGANGLVLRSWGDALLPVAPPPTRADLFGVSGDGDTLFVVGAGGVVLSRTPDQGWTVLREPDGTDLMAVSAMSATEFFAVGKGGRILRYADGAFSTESTGITYDLYGITASAAGGVRAVGAYGTLLEKGSVAWVRSQISGPASTLRAIWRAPDGRMFAVGSEGSVAVYDGLNWHLQVTNDPEEPGRDLYAVLGAASDDVTAVGDRGVVVHFDGDRWSVMTVAGPYNGQADLRGIATRAAAGGTQVTVAAGLGSLALERREDAWYDRLLGVTTDLLGVAVDAAGSLVIVGAGGMVLRGQPDRLGAFPQAVPGALDAVSLPWAVGDGGALVDLSGDVPKVLPTTFDEDLTDVWSVSGVAWVSGAQGSVFRVLEDGTMTRYATRPLPLRAVCFRDGSLWTAGDAGRVDVDPGDGVRTLSTGTSSVMRDLLPLPGGRVAVAGDNGLILECDASTCQRVLEEPGTFLYGLGDLAGTGLAVGWAGTVLRRAPAGGWTHLDPGTRRVFKAVAGSADGTFAALAGPDGSLSLCTGAAVTAE